MEKEYLTVAEFAEKADVTIQAVYQRLVKDLKPYLKIFNGKKHVHIRGLQVYDRKNALKNLKSDSINSTRSLKQVEPLEEIVELLKKQLELLQSELDVKNQQIEDLTEQLRQKDKQIDAANRHVDQANQLTAMSSMKNLQLEADNQKVRWWQRFKK